MRWRKGGPEFRSSDGQFTFHPRGRVMVDFSSTHGSAFDARNITGTDLASGRLGAEGRMGPLGYKIDADFAGNDVSLKDTYLSWDTRVSGLPTEIYVGNKLRTVASMAAPAASIRLHAAQCGGVGRSPAERVLRAGRHHEGDR